MTTFDRPHQEIFNDLKASGNIIFECITGSQCYGTATPESDIDYKFVYVLPQDNILGLEYIEQLNITKDNCGYEIRRFIELLKLNNPTILELLFTPDECVQYCHPAFQTLRDERFKFITKICKNSFGGYARQQINKARGQNKMMNWEMEKITRKTPLDFCYILLIDSGKTRPLMDHIKFMAEGYNRTIEEQQSLYGLVKLDHTKHNYAVYFDPSKTLGFAGILNEDMTSTSLRLSSIPKGLTPLFNIFFNEEAYTIHCADYKKYQIWLKQRNIQRWVDVDNHGQKIDGKNMSHCIRLIEMGLEIANGLGIIVRRPNKDELLDIRKGKVDLETILTMADAKIKAMDIAFDQSDLPASVDHQFCNEMLLKVRHTFYNS